VLEQPLPQVPQLELSVSLSLQLPPQQIPFAPQLVPQPPQLVTSVLVLTHLPAQSVSPLLHVMLQLPPTQLLVPLAGSVH